MKMCIGKNIKDQRERLKMTQAELAEKCGVSSKLVWSWEANRTEPSAGAVQKMLRIFDCTEEELCKQINVDLSYDEYLLVEMFRAAPISKRKNLQAYVDFLLGKKGSDPE